MKVKDKESTTIRDFNEQFKTDADCHNAIPFRATVFPDGGTCDNAANPRLLSAPQAARRQYACAWCGFQIAPTAGTIFHKSPTSLKTWFHAMFLMTASRNGVSAMELMRQTGVTYKTAWRINHQIRQLMNVPMGQQERFGGTVEADEAYIGGVRKGKGGRGAAGKTPVVGVLRRGGKIVAKATPDVSARSLVTNICKTTRRGTTVMTDEFPSYGSLKSLGFNHKTINHSEGKYVNGNIHTNGIESFWAQIKRSINGTFHHVSPKHLQKYLNEFAYRHNLRQSELPDVSPVTCDCG